MWPNRLRSCGLSSTTTGAPRSSALSTARFTWHSASRSSRSAWRCSSASLPAPSWGRNRSRLSSTSRCTCSNHWCRVTVSLMCLRRLWRMGLSAWSTSGLAAWRYSCSSASSRLRSSGRVRSKKRTISARSSCSACSMLWRCAGLRCCASSSVMALPLGPSRVKTICSPSRARRKWRAWAKLPRAAKARASSLWKVLAIFSLSAFTSAADRRLGMSLSSVCTHSCIPSRSARPWPAGRRSGRGRSGRSKSCR